MSLKDDLYQKLNNEKYFKEMELARLAQEPNMNYEEKIENMSALLEFLAINEMSQGLMKKYFKEPEHAQSSNAGPTGQHGPTGQQSHQE